MKMNRHSVSKFGKTASRRSCLLQLIIVAVFVVGCHAYSTSQQSVLSMPRFAGSTGGDAVNTTDSDVNGTVTGVNSTKGVDSTCVAKVLEFTNKLTDTNVPTTEWPGQIKTFCEKIFSNAKTQVRIEADTVTKTCARANGLMERHPAEKRSTETQAIANEFCFELRNFFEHLVRSQPAGEMAYGMASNMATAGKDACCLPHAGPGCYDKKPDKNIQDCVCKGTGSKVKKSDPHCCESEWDLVCTENVEWFGCAACPQPE
jgi:hypothetical protein